MAWVTSSGERGRDGSGDRGRRDDGRSGPPDAGAGRRPGAREHRTRHRGQARRGQRRPGGAARRGPPADRGRARRRQDDAEQGPRALDRPHRASHPVHAGPAALGRHRRVGVQPEHPRVRVPPRWRLREHRRRRRDQPRLPQDPVRAAGVHGGAPGHRRQHDLPARDAVHGDRDPEPDRDGGHLRPARGPARPVHGPGLGRLPGGGRRDRDARLAHRRQPARRPRAGDRRRRGAQADRDRRPGLRLAGGAAVRRRDHLGDPAFRGAHPRRLAPGHAAPGPRRQGDGGHERPRLRAARRPPPAVTPGAGPPPPPERGGRHERPVDRCDPRLGRRHGSRAGRRPQSGGSR